MLSVLLGLLVSSKPVSTPPRHEATTSSVCVARRERLVERHRRPVSRPWARWLSRARLSR